MTAVRKAELVLRLLKGESEETVSEEGSVPKDELLKWKEVFLEAGTAGLKGSGGARDSGRLARENAQLRQKLGDMLLEKELKRRR